MPLAPGQIESLRNLQETTNSDVAWRQRRDALNHRRLSVVSEMQRLLEEFLSGRTSLRVLKNIFDQKTRTEWKVFGLAGTSGAMFLNMLANNARDPEAVARELKAALPVPSEAAAEPSMKRLFTFLTELNNSDGITGAGVRPNRVPFFLSAWWHIQQREAWPPYYTTARQALISLGAFTETGDPVADYFRFRQIWMECARELDADAWTLESILAYAYEAGRHTGPPGPPPDPPPPEPPGDPPPEETRTHTEMQWMLATLGRQLGCSVWIASNDQGTTFNGARLSSFCMPELPTLGIGDQPQRLVRLIDILWLRGTHQIVAAFEVESTTSIYSGLLRMADLNTLCPNLSFPCYIVVPAARAEKVRRELSRPAFDSLGLPDRCGYITFEDLRRDHNPLMRLATSPEAIRRLAKFVQDSEQSAE